VDRGKDGVSDIVRHTDAGDLDAGVYHDDVARAEHDSRMSNRTRVKVADFSSVAGRRSFGDGLGDDSKGGDALVLHPRDPRLEGRPGRCFGFHPRPSEVGRARRRWCGGPRR
jgi:hypothetical protein